MPAHAAAKQAATPGTPGVEHTKVHASAGGAFQTALGRGLPVVGWLDHLPPAPLQFRQPHTLPNRRGLDVRARQHRALDRGSHSTTDQTVEPVVVWATCANLPLIHHATPGFGFHAVFRREMLSQELMLGGFSTKQ